MHKMAWKTAIWLLAMCMLCNFFETMIASNTEESRSRRSGISSISGSSSDSKGDDDFAVIGYLPEWRFEGANFDKICEHSTHVIFFSLEPNANGDIVGFDRFPNAAVLEDSLRAASTSEGKCKRLICFGGNGRSSGFSAMTRNKKSLKKFVKNVISLITQYGFDGVDYNWEYPGYEFGRGYGQLLEVEKDYSGLSLLVSETRKQLNLLEAANSALGANDRYLLTLAYYPDGRQEHMLYRGKVHLHADYLHMMTYDQSGAMHSTYEFAAKAIKQAIDADLPARKLTVGVPFYGRHSRTGDWTTYEDIVQKYQDDGLGSEIDVVPAMDGEDNAFIGFNNQATISKKVDLALQLKLGGIMIWEVGQDCRLAKTIRNGKEHKRTCPKVTDSLLFTMTAAIKKYKEDNAIQEEILNNEGYIVEEGKENIIKNNINDNNIINKNDNNDNKADLKSPSVEL